MFFPFLIKITDEAVSILEESCRKLGYDADGFIKSFMKPGEVIQIIDIHYEENDSSISIAYKNKESRLYFSDEFVSFCLSNKKSIYMEV